MDNDLRQKMKVIFDQYQVEPDPQSWEKIKNSLHRYQKKRAPLFFWYFFSFLVLTISFNRDVASHHNFTPIINQLPNQAVATEWYRPNQHPFKEKKCPLFWNHGNPCANVLNDRSAQPLVGLNLEVVPSALGSHFNEMNSRQSSSIENDQTYGTNKEFQLDLVHLAVERTHQDSIIEQLQALETYHKNTSPGVDSSSSPAPCSFEPIAGLKRDTNRAALGSIEAISVQKANTRLDEANPLLPKVSLSSSATDLHHHKPLYARGLFFITAELVSSYHLMKSQVVGEKVADQLLTLPSFSRDRLGWGVQLNYAKAWGSYAKTLVRLSLAAQQLAVHYDYKVLSTQQAYLNIVPGAQPRYTTVVLDHLVRQEQWTLLGVSAELGFKLNQTKHRFDVFTGTELNYSLAHQRLGIWPSASLEYMINPKIVTGVKLKWQATPLSTPDELVSSRLYAVGLLIRLRMNE